MRVVDCIVDLCDADGDGEVDYNEVANMILCDDIIELLALVPDKSIKSAKLVRWPAACAMHVPRGTLGVARARERARSAHAP